MSALKSPSVKVAVSLTTLVLLTVIGVTVSLSLAWRAEERAADQVAGSVHGLVKASDLETALRRQRGFVADYIISGGDERRLDDLSKLRSDLERLLEAAERAFASGEERRLLDEAREVYGRYDSLREGVIELFQAGDREALENAYLDDLYILYQETALAFEQVFAINVRAVDVALAKTHNDLSRLTVFMAVNAALVVLLAAALGWFLYSGIFDPLRVLAREASRLESGAEPVAPPRGDPIETIRDYLGALLSESETARTEIALSRREFAQTERLAALGGAVARLAHEIRNRLFVLEGYAHLISRRDRTIDVARQHAAAIGEDAGRLKEMLKDVMDFSRPTAREFKRADLNELVVRTAKASLAQIPAGVTVAFEIDPTTPDVFMNEARIEQVVVNLVRNALEAVGESGKVTLSTAPVPGGGAAFSVRDDGPGIDDETKRNLFTPFFTTKPRGSGLGLAICRQIVLDHGGAMEVESAPGRGTVMTITLPGGGVSQAP